MCGKWQNNTCYTDSYPDTVEPLEYGEVRREVYDIHTEGGQLWGKRRDDYEIKNKSVSCFWDRGFAIMGTKKETTSIKEWI